MTDRYCKLTKPMPISKTKAGHIASMIYDHWTIPYGIPALSASIQCHTNPDQVLQNRLYHSWFREPQNNDVSHRTYGLVEQYNRKLIASLRYYDAEHQRGWDVFGSHSHVHEIPGSTPRMRWRCSAWCCRDTHVTWKTMTALQNFQQMLIHDFTFHLGSKNASPHRCDKKGSRQKANHRATLVQKASWPKRLPHTELKACTVSQF